MKQIHVFSLSLLMVTSLSQPTFAARGDHEGHREPRERMSRSGQGTKESAPEVVRWKGVIQDDPSSHTTEHQHALKFVRAEDQKTYDLERSPELIKLHHETEKNLVVEIEAEKTSSFLFWGGNLVVKNFTVLGDASSPIPHRTLASDQQLVFPGEAATEGESGTLQCESRRYRPDEIVQVNFVSEATGDSTKISNPTRDLKSLCPQFSKTTQKVKVVGSKTGKFLLWGGNLKVSRVSLTQ